MIVKLDSVHVTWNCCGNCQHLKLMEGMEYVCEKEVADASFSDDVTNDYFIANYIDAQYLKVCQLHKRDK